MNKFLVNSRQMLCILAISVQKKIKIQFHDTHVIRMALSDAKPHALEVVEEIFIELLKTIIPETYSNIKIYRSFIKIDGQPEYAIVSTEFYIVDGAIDEAEIKKTNNIVRYYISKIYVLDQRDMFFDVHEGFGETPSSLKKQIKSLSIERLRKTGGKSTQREHLITLNEEDYKVKTFRPKPHFTNGLPDRRLKGYIVGFHAHNHKYYIELCYKHFEDNKNGRSIVERFYYVKNKCDKLIRVSIDEECMIEIVVREKIDDKLNLFWGIVDLHLL